MPRLRLRKIVVSLTILIFTSLVMLNIHLRDSQSIEDLSEQVKKSGLENSLHPSSGPVINSTKPWFMKNGAVYPKFTSNLPVWPEDDPSSDRIVNQLMYIPEDYTHIQKSKKLKKIVLFFGKGGWHDLPLGQAKFLQDKCPVNTCELTTSLDKAEHADAIFFKDRFSVPSHRRHPNQVWILFLLECPLNTQGFNNLNHVFNWTATYRHDSDLVAPYEKFVSYSSGNISLEPVSDHAEGKTKKVAWFVSNCAARNRRLAYARELSKYIEVDIYGTCGKKRCPRTQTKKCFEMLNKDYKFYLAFENSNCRDYVTEKFYVNGLGQDILPIVMGAHPDDYRRGSPPNSYIHVEDFASPQQLAQYLHLLDSNATLYNEYFRYKHAGEFINTYFWCRLCALLHAPTRNKSYSDIHEWWAGSGKCTSQKWGNIPPVASP